MTALAGTPAAAIIRAIADASDRWSDADFPPRVRALERIVQRTGYSVPVVEYALDRLFFSVTQRALEQTIAGEIGSLGVLDGTSAAPVGSVCIISSRTTIGVALVPAIFALCAKCDVLVKDREDELIAAFFETLREELEAFGRAARAQHWSSQSAPQSLREFDAVVAFGSNSTLAQIAAQGDPQARFIGFGSRASAGYVTRETLADESAAEEVADGAARDLVLYESEGCLSLHVLFVERAKAQAHDRFARLLASAIERASIEFPPGELTPQQQASLGEHHRLAAFRAAAGSGSVYGRPGEFALVVDPPAGEPPAFLPRTLGMHLVDGPAQAAHYLRAHAVPLEGFALSADRADVVSMALEAGAVRLTGFGELQHPPLEGHHGGRPRIAEFIRWIDRTL